MSIFKTFIDDNIYNIVKNYKNEATSSTIKTHILNIHNIDKLINKKDKNTKIDIKTFDDFEKVKEIILNEDNTVFTKRNKLSSLIVLLRALKKDDKLINKYSELLEILTNRSDKEKYKKTQKEEDKWMTMDEIKDHVNDLKLNIPSNIETYNDLLKYMKYIALYIHINIEAIRNDLSDTIITNDGLVNINNDYNYILLNGLKFLINNYKTKKAHNAITIDLNDDDFDVLNKYFIQLNTYKLNNQIDDDFIFINKDGTKMTRNKYTKFFISIFDNKDKKLNVNMIRKISASNNTNIKGIKEKARRMGHTINTHLNYYVKE